ncbi:M4 family metallopeptidase [Flavobacterium terrigena]|uniref:Por secretion system C-terminal sorting domain-containing protein n=1 Tax=Flavobacterium terrigena TaxID=402734 RepID=A0A1H6SAI8_9FLAO|nr:M4 family metallopeptidase [Flavobacterium terrigena]SEI64879.1 Por secretion system C-terminal sorting domain-containing protein [Flavobacterium terrigena]
MKINYLKAFGLALLLSSSAYSQKNEKYNGDQAFQKTINLNGFYSSETAIKEFSKLYSLNNLNSFVPKKSTSDEAGFTHQRFQQFYNGIKVEFGTLITHMKDGNIVSVNGELYNAEGLNLNSTLLATEAFNKALTFVNAQTYLWEDSVSAEAMNYTKPKGELVVFPIVNSGEVRLAYKFDIYAKTPISRDEIFVDANTGEILYKNPIIKHATHLVSEYEVEQNAKKFEKIALNKENALFTPFVAASAATRYSGTRTIETTQTGPNSYVLNEATRGNGNGIVTYNCEKTDTYPTTNFVDNDNNWIEHNNTNKDNAALDAHWGAEKTYDFWKEIFNRNSFDDEGAQIKSYVHYDNTPATTAGYQNAFWNGSVMTYGDGSTWNVLTAIDVCGHEIGHAVCSYTANLAYQNQSGAMNEGLSDIWGVCIEQYGRNGNLNSPVDTANPGTSAIWKIGEDITSTALRSVSYPRSKGNPDTFKGTSYSATADDGTCTPSQANDNCGVHNNSGVLNHWFYIVTAGKAGTNNAPASSGGPFAYNVSGIGMAKSSQITYYAERDYLTSNATFMDMRNATIAVASSLYCATSPEVQSVTKAWKAVNVGANYVGYANDVALKSISGGNVNVACGATYSPAIIFENSGTAVINSVSISYNIDGGANTTANWTGTLSNCAVQSYTIPVSGLTRGTHVLNVTTTVTSDGNAANNTKSILIVVNDAGTINVTNTFNSASDVLVSIDQNGKTNSVWQRGAVNKTLLTNTVAGSNVYATKLTGNYPDATTSYLVSQCYNLTNLSSPTVSFDMAFDLESNWDIIYFEYSTDSGATWNVLGTSNDASWYNSSRLPDGTDCFNCIGKQWTGNYATAPTGGTGVNGNKRTYTHSLTDLGSTSNAIFRFTFVSDDAANQEGVMIDNFIIQGALSSQSNQIDGFALYPNPTKGKLNISLPTSDKVAVELFDLRGRSIYQNNFEAQGALFTKELDFSATQAGVYILNVKTEGKQVSKRIIIE